jgi:hypothetical protein
MNRACPISLPHPRCPKIASVCHTRARPRRPVLASEVGRLLWLAYCAARGRLAPDITTVGSAVLSGLIAAWIGLNYPVQTNGYRVF